MLLDAQNSSIKRRQDVIYTMPLMHSPTAMNTSTTRPLTPISLTTPTKSCHNWRKTRPAVAPHIDGSDTLLDTTFESRSFCDSPKPQRSKLDTVRVKSSSASIATENSSFSTFDADEVPGTIKVSSNDTCLSTLASLVPRDAPDPNASFDIVFLPHDIDTPRANNNKAFKLALLDLPPPPSGEHPEPTISHSMSSTAWLAVIDDIEVSKSDVVTQRKTVDPTPPSSLLGFRHRIVVTTNSNSGGSAAATKNTNKNKAVPAIPVSTEGGFASEAASRKPSSGGSFLHAISACFGSLFCIDPSTDDDVKCANHLSKSSEKKSRHQDQDSQEQDSYRDEFIQLTKVASSVHGHNDEDDEANTTDVDIRRLQLGKKHHQVLTRISKRDSWSSFDDNESESDVIFACCAAPTPERKRSTNVSVEQSRDSLLDDDESYADRSFSRRRKIEQHPRIGPEHHRHDHHRHHQGRILKILPLHSCSYSDDEFEEDTGEIFDTTIDEQSEISTLGASVIPAPSARRHGPRGSMT